VHSPFVKTDSHTLTQSLTKKQTAPTLAPIDAAAPTTFLTLSLPPPRHLQAGNLVPGGDILSVPNIDGTYKNSQCTSVVSITCYHQHEFACTSISGAFG
jgi:hypothetical protein